MRQQWTISQPDCDVWWKGFYITTDDDRLGGWTEKRCHRHFPKPNLHHKKVMVTVWWSDACLIHYIFLILVKPLHLRSMLSKSMRCTKNCNACSQYWSTEWGPTLHGNIWLHVSKPMFQKLNESSYGVLHHPPYSPDVSPTDYHFFKHLDYFLQGKCFHNQQEAEVAFQEFVRSQSTDFYTIGINKQFSLEKMFWLQWFLYWLIKMCLSLIIMFLIQGPKPQLHLHQHNNNNVIYSYCDPKWKAWCWEKGDAGFSFNSITNLIHDLMYIIHFYPGKELKFPVCKIQVWKWKC